MAESLLFVTQVAPYRDGPAGVHGVLDQAAVGVAQVAEINGLAAQRVDDVRASAARRDPRGACARAVHDRRDAVECGSASRDPRTRARRTPRRVLDPFRNRLVLLVGRVRRARRRPLRRPSVDADRSPPTCSIRSIPRARTSARRGTGTTRCTSSAICAPTRRCCSACARANSTCWRPARARRRSATRSRGASREGRGPRVLDQPRPLPGRVGVAAVPAAPRRRPRPGRCPRERRQAAQLLQLGVLAAASGRVSSRTIRARSTISTRSSSAGANGRRARLDALLGAASRSGRLALETTEEVDCGAYTRRRVVFDTEATMSVPAYLLVPKDRTRARARGASRSTVTARASRSSAASNAADRATTTRTRSRRAATSSSRPTCAGSANAPTGCRPTSTTATGISCAQRWPASFRSNATSGICSARSTCSRRIRSSTRLASRPPACRTAGRARCSSRRSTNACVPSSCPATSRRGARPHTIPWNMCGSQVMNGQLGALEHLDVAALDRTATAAGRVRHRRRHLSRRRGAGDRRGAAARVRERRCTRRRARARCVRRRPPLAWCRGPRISGAIPVTINDRLDELGLVLPGPYPPHEPLDAVVVHGGRARTSGQLPRDHDGNLVHPGVARRRRALGRAGRGGRTMVRAQRAVGAARRARRRSTASNACSPCSASWPRRRASSSSPPSSTAPAGCWPRSSATAAGTAAPRSAWPPCPRGGAVEIEVEVAIS